MVGSATMSGVGIRSLVPDRNHGTDASQGTQATPSFHFIVSCLCLCRHSFTVLYSSPSLAMSVD